MSNLLILLGIIATALTPTITIVVSRFMDSRDRREIKEKAELARQEAAKARTHALGAVEAVGVATQAVEAVAEQVTNLKVTTTAQLEEIHLLVNSRLTQALERIKSLEEALGMQPDDDIPETEHNGHS